MQRFRSNLKELRNFFLANDEKIITILIFLLVYGFLFLMLDVKSVFTDTHVTGGDTGSHIYIPQYLKEIFPRMKWWSPDWYSGFPFLYFYPPLMYFVTVLLSFIIPINIAFKMVIFSGVLIFPIAFYLTLKWLGMRFPIPQLGALFSLFMIFLEKYTIYGGNLASLLAGQFTHTMSIALLLMFIGLMYKGMKEEKYLVWNTLLGASVILTHPISGMLLIPLILFFPFQPKKIKQNVAYVLPVYTGIFLLSAFWTLGLVWYKGYSGTMQWAGQFNIHELFPDFWLPLIVMAILGVFYAIYKKERSMVGIFALLWISVLMYLSLNNTSIWNTRFLPYILCSILLLAAYSLGSVLIILKKLFYISIGLVLTIVVILTVGTVKQTTTFVDSWFKWNFEGYEAKKSWPEADGLFTYLKTLPHGQVMWEYRPEYEKYGTPRILETIPTFSGQPTYEGLLIESGVTGPFHFTNQAETTDKPTSAIAGFKYPPFDFEKGIKHLRMSGARYFVAYSDMVKEKANGSLSLIKMKDTGPFSVYQIKSSNMVEPVSDFEIQEKDKAWIKRSFEWYKGANPEKPIVFFQNSNEKSVLQKTKKESNLKVPENIKQTNDSIEFDVDKVDVPYLVKISYFPTWKVKGAKGPYLVSPAYMMVIPTEKHVKLYFSYGWVDWLGIFLSLIGIVYLIFVNRIYKYCHSGLDPESRKK